MTNLALAFLAAGLGAGLSIIGAALGIGKLAAAAMEGSARQPSAAGDIRTSMIIAAALIEGATLFALASAVAPDFWSLLACRAGVGVCIAGVPAAAMAYMGEEIAIDARSRAMGLYIAANALGGMSVRFLSALVTEWLSWRFGLAALGLVGALAAVAFWRLLPPSRHFVPHSLQPSLLLADLRRIWADPGLPWLQIGNSTPAIGTEVTFIGDGGAVTPSDTETYWNVTGSDPNFTWTEVGASDPHNASGYKSTTNRKRFARAFLSTRMASASCGQRSAG